MTTRGRRILFTIFALCFVATSIVVLMYASGYRITREGRVVQTGVLFVNGKPRDVSVFVNQKQVGDKLPLRLQHMVPGSYTVRVEKEGYHAWEKTLNIQPRETTFATELVLWKQTAPEQRSPRTDVRALVWDGDELIIGPTPTFSPLLRGRLRGGSVRELSQQENRLLLWEQSSGALMLADKDADTPPKQLSISAPQKPIVAWNPDIKRWLIATTHELWLLGSDGALSLIERTSVPITAASFLADHPYVLTHTGDDIRVLELDDRDRRNVITLVTRPGMRAVTVNAAASAVAFADDEGVWMVGLK